MTRPRTGGHPLLRASRVRPGNGRVTREHPSPWPTTDPTKRSAGPDGRSSSVGPMTPRPRASTRRCSRGGSGRRPQRRPQGRALSLDERVGWSLGPPAGTALALLQTPLGDPPAIRKYRADSNTSTTSHSNGVGEKPDRGASVASASLTWPFVKRATRCTTTGHRGTRCRPPSARYRAACIRIAPTSATGN